MVKDDWQIILFYKYVHIKDPESLKQKQKEFCELLDLKGRTIIASEGINGTLEGTKENTEKYIKEMIKDSRFSNMNWKRSVGDGKSFPRLKVKTRKEIVSLHLEDNAGVCDVDPNQNTGIHLKAEELHEWIKSGKEFYIIDMRNAYEHKVGYFEGSILPNLKNFRDLPKVVEEIAHLKNKTVLTVCTGGVRCEKASGFLITQGFTDVYQLENGIVTYMEKYPNEDFKGKLYVFDGRVSMGFYTDDPKHEIVGRCEACDGKTENYVNCANINCHRHFIACINCLEKNGGKIFCPKSNSADEFDRANLSGFSQGGCVLSRHGRPVKEKSI